MLVVVSVSCLVCCPVAHADDAPDLLQELLGRLRWNGVVECVVKRSDKPDVEVFGYDNESGAWYEYHAGLGWGRAAGGEVTVIYAGDELLNWARSQTSSSYLETCALPTVGLRKWISAPGAVQSVARTPSGGFSVSVVAPNYDPLEAGAEVTREVRDRWTFVFETDELGCPIIRRRADDASDRIEYRKLGLAGGVVPICTVTAIPGDWVLASASLAAPGSRRFTHESIREAIQFGRVSQSAARMESVRAREGKPEAASGGGAPLPPASGVGLAVGARLVLVSGVLLLVVSLIVCAIRRWVGK